MVMFAFRMPSKTIQGLIIQVLFIGLLSNIFPSTSYAQTDGIEADSVPPRPTLMVGVKESPPFTYVGQDGKFSGISVYLWDQIAERIDVNYEFVPLSLPEILNGLKNKELDVAINPLTVTSDRIHQMDFTQPFYITNSVIATQAKVDTSIWSAVKKIFSFRFLQAVFLIILCLVGFGGIIWLLERRHNEQFAGGWKGIWSGVWWSAATMTTVGYGDFAPKSFWGRVVGIIWMFVALLVVSGLMAGIASALTISHFENEWEDVNDLRKVQTGTVGSSASEVFLKDQLIDVIPFGSIQEGMTELKSDKIDAFVYDEPILRYELEHDSSAANIRILPFKFNTQYYSFAVPKGDTLDEKINPVLLEIIETPQWKVMLADYNLGGM